MANPSPGPSHPQSMHIPYARQKNKPYSMGITAGAEDVKYHAKYKELKRKVKEIEADNDKLHYKVLQAKRNIQRMKLERAILYERLTAIPSSPELRANAGFPPLPAGGLPPSLPQTAPPPPIAQHGNHHHPHRETRYARESPDPEPGPEYLRTTESHLPRPGSDIRPVPMYDTPMALGGAPPPHPSRRASDSGHRHLPPMPPLPPMETSRSHPHSSPSVHHQNAVGSPHTHRRSQSSSRSRSHHQTPLPYHPGPNQPQPYPESLPPVHQSYHHSPPIPERERTRHHERVDIPGPHGQHQAPMASLSPRPRSSDSRSTGRIHNHQRLGPGTYINREDALEYEREHNLEREREREWERERERYRGVRDRDRERDIAPPLHSPPFIHRPRQPMDYQDHAHVATRMRDDPGYYHDPAGSSGGGGGGGGGYSRLSRSGTPGSGSAGGEGPSRPDSGGPYFELPERTRSYMLRPVTQTSEDMDFVHDDGRSQSRDRGPASGGGGGVFPPPLDGHSRSSLDSRKRNRHDMDVDEEGPGGGSMTFAGSHLPEDRGSKRYHRDVPHRGGEEDGRTGS